MAVNLTQRSVLDAKCDECGKCETFSNDVAAATWAMEHEDSHVTSRAVARSLGNRVFIHDAPGLPWFSIITSAIDYAKERGFAFLTWNGWVYPADAASVDFGHPLCRASDLVVDTLPGASSPR